MRLLLGLSTSRKDASLVAICLALAAATSSRAAPPTLLSETGLYTEIASGVVSKASLPFDPQYALWTDGALKRRWISLPMGSRINTQDMNQWEFPVGTKLWKEFAFGPKKIETRFMQKTQNGWEFATYLWNDEHTEARIAPDSGVSNYYSIDGTHKYSIPAVYECEYCHSGGKDAPLGFNALGLSDARDSPLAPGSLTLNAFIEKGWISNAPVRPIVIPSPSRLERDAIGLLQSNCSGCHRDSGSASFSDLHLDVDVLATERAELNIFKTAFRPSGGFAIPGLEGPTYGIFPGDPDRSAILYRMSSRTPGIQMPPLGSVIPHTAGVQTVRAWIQAVIAP